MTTITRQQMIIWLDECARYFEKRDTKGEDMAHWSNVYNAQNARAISAELQKVDERTLPMLPPGLRYEFVAISFPDPKWTEPHRRDVLYVGQVNETGILNAISKIPTESSEER